MYIVQIKFAYVYNNVFIYLLLSYACYCWWAVLRISESEILIPKHFTSCSSIMQRVAMTTDIRLFSRCNSYRNGKPLLPPHTNFKIGNNQPTTILKTKRLCNIIYI